MIMIPAMIWNRQTPETGTPNQSDDDGAGRNGLQPHIADIVRAMAGSVPDPFIVLDEKANVICCNDPATDFAGQDMTGSHLSQHIRAPAVLDAVSRVSASGLPEQVAYERRTGGQRRFEVFISPIEADASESRPAGVPSVTVLIRDLSAQQNLEKMRADFVADASHELRTPLASMTGFIETLQGPARNDDKAREKFLGRMLEQAHRMRRLIDDLLSLSRIEMNLHRTPSGLVDMSEVVRYSLELLSPLARAACCEIRSSTPEGMMVTGEREELIQVSQNLIENAIKYGASDNGIDVEVKHNKTRGRIEFSVTDHGTGIDQQYLPRLTERFYRINEHASRTTGGTGLGLAIVKHIALRHRGQLDISSRKGIGSTFMVWLPFAKEHSKAAE